jgi:hypothetical protein
VGVLRLRVRSTLRRRGAGLATLVLLIAFLGGLSIGAISGARRTSSSFSRLVASTNPSDLLVVPDFLGNDPGALAAIRKLPQIRRVAVSSSPDVIRLARDGKPSSLGSGANSVFPVSPSPDLFLRQDKVSVVQGRMLDPRRVDEIVVTPVVAAMDHLRIGEVARMGVYSQADTSLPGYGTAAVKPDRIVRVRLVGIVDVFAHVIEDDADRVPGYLMVSPALARPSEEGPFVVGLQLAHGASDDAAVEAEIRKVAPNAGIVGQTDIRTSAGSRAVGPDALALGGFGVIAAVAALFIALEAVARLVRGSAPDLRTLRSLGGGPRLLFADAAGPILVAAVAGGVLAGAVAVAISPLSPIGPVRPVEPAPGVSWDLSVVAPGVAVLIVIPVLFALWRTWRILPTPERRGQVAPGTRSIRPIGRRLPVSAAVGTILLRRRSTDGTGLPTAPAVVGAALAVAVVLVTQVFGASLQSLVDHPARYGWNWDVELRSSYGGVSNINDAAASRILRADPDVASWSGSYFFLPSINGKVVPALSSRPGAPVSPSTLTGRNPNSDDEVALGSSTLEQLHLKIGDRVSYSAGPVHRSLRVVGTAVLPAVGSASSLHTEMASGAVIPEDLVPPGTGLGEGDGPEAIFVRFRPHVDRATAVHRLQRLAPTMQQTTAATDPNADGPPTVVDIERPAEIVNYRTIHTTPALLSAALIVGACAALGLMLLGSVNSLRREFAILRALGLTGSQVRSAVAWQSTITVVVGAVIGVPVGIVAGRWLWHLFANRAHVPAISAIPTSVVGYVAIGALAIANLVAILPGLVARRVTAASVLQRE